MLFECFEQEQVFDQGRLNSDLLAFQIFDGFDSRLANDHVAAIAVIKKSDDLALGAVGTIDEGVGRDNCHRIDFARREGVKRRQVVKPNEIDIDASLLEPFLLLGDLEDRESRPIAIADFQRFRGGPNSTQTRPDDACQQGKKGFFNKFIGGSERMSDCLTGIANCKHLPCHRIAGSSSSAIRGARLTRCAQKGKPPGLVNDFRHTQEFAPAECDAYHRRTRSAQHLRPTSKDGRGGFVQQWQELLTLLPDQIGIDTRLDKQPIGSRYRLSEKAGVISRWNCSP